jgi:uncharacterized protein (TIGR02646 family)
MIHIDRFRIMAPSILSSDAAKEEYQQASDFFSRPSKGRAQETFNFQVRIYKAPEVMNALKELFYGKCAFCESYLLSTSFPEVEHFRPKVRTVDVDGKLYLDHYWWLAYEWTNLYLICSICNRNKGTVFPVQGPRASLGAGPDELDIEKPLILDPCRDNPEDHLIFSENGTVASDTDRGRVTIEIFNLNRGSLVEERRFAHQELRDELPTTILAASQASVQAQLESLLDPARPYAGLRRQFIAEWGHNMSLVLETH